MSLETAELTLTLTQLTEMPVRSILPLGCARPAAALIQRASEGSWVFSVCVDIEPFNPAAALQKFLRPDPDLNLWTNEAPEEKP